MSQQQEETVPSGEMDICISFWTVSFSFATGASSRSGPMPSGSLDLKHRSNILILFALQPIMNMSTECGSITSFAKPAYSRQKECRSLCSRQDKRPNCVNLNVGSVSTSPEEFQAVKGSIEVVVTCVPETPLTTEFSFAVVAAVACSCTCFNRNWRFWLFSLPFANYLGKGDLAHVTRGVTHSVHRAWHDARSAFRRGSKFFYPSQSVVRNCQSELHSTSDSNNEVVTSYDRTYLQLVNEGEV